jgi:hypothetical protein
VLAQDGLGGDLRDPDRDAWCLRVSFFRRDPAPSAIIQQIGPVSRPLRQDNKNKRFLRALVCPCAVSLCFDLWPA